MGDVPNLLRNHVGGGAYFLRFGGNRDGQVVFCIGVQTTLRNEVPHLVFRRIENPVLGFVFDDRVHQRPLACHRSTDTLLDADSQVLSRILTAISDKRRIKLVAVAEPSAVDAHPLCILRSIQQSEHHRRSIIRCIQFYIR